MIKENTSSRTQFMKYYMETGELRKKAKESDALISQLQQQNNKTNQRKRELKLQVKRLENENAFSPQKQSDLGGSDQMNIIECKK